MINVTEGQTDTSIQSLASLRKYFNFVKTSEEQQQRIFLLFGVQEIYNHKLYSKIIVKLLELNLGTKIVTCTLHRAKLQVNYRFFCLVADKLVNNFEKKTFSMGYITKLLIMRQYVLLECIIQHNYYRLYYIISYISYYKKYLSLSKT